MGLQFEGRAVTISSVRAELWKIWQRKLAAIAASEVTILFLQRNVFSGVGEDAAGVVLETQLD